MLTMVSFLSTDTSCFQMNDSSYDSLENELNEDADVPCSDLVTKLGQGSRSMDSVLTLSDYDLEQPEVEGLLTLSDFDLDQSKDEHIQMKQPLESKPVNVFVPYRKVSLGEHTRAPAGPGTPSCLPVAAANAPKVLRRHRRCSEPSIDYLDTKLSYLREFYQKKLRKSSCDAVLSRKDEDYLKQTQPPKKGGKTCFRQSSVTGTDISKKNATNEHIKKKSLSGHEGNQVTPLAKSKPVAISVASYSHASSQDRSRKQPFDADTCGFSPPHMADARKSSQVHRRCSEPSIDDQNYKLSYLRGIYSKKQHKSSWETGHLHEEEDYLRRHKSLQLEGQKLINQSLVMGIEVGKSSGTHQSTEKALPPRLNLCPRASYSSLSSPGTSPSGSSVSSQDSAFSQISEHSVFTPTETSSPIDCTFQAQRKQEEELSTDCDSPALGPGIPGPSTGQASSHLTYLRKGPVEQPSHMHSVTVHPSAWLRSGLVTLKNWSLKKKTRAARPEDRKICSLKEPLGFPPHAPGTPEADPLQESQDDIHLRADEGPGVAQTARGCGFYACQDSEQHSASPFHLLEGRLKLGMKLQEGEESVGQHPSDSPWEGASANLEIVEDVTSPDTEPTTACDAGDRHLTKDSDLQ